MNRSLRLRSIACAASLLSLLALSACRSDHVETTIENRTGAPIQLLEVDYPSASFGADHLASGADFHYRIQVRGSGEFKISYTDQNGKSFNLKGPDLADHTRGRIEVVLLPAGKAQFKPSWTATQTTPE